MNRRQHDLGDTKGTPLHADEKTSEPWAKMITSLAAAMGDHDIISSDELRRALDYASADALAADYCERWPEAMINLLEEKGLLTREEVWTKMDAIKEKLEE